MIQQIKRETHIIDAKGKVLGRLASEIAILLQGKHKADYLPYLDKGDFVVVKNVREMVISGKKIRQKKYYHHSGYPGGLKEIPMEKLFEKNPGEILKKAVWGMLPKNRLRKRFIKRLKIEK